MTLQDQFKEETGEEVFVSYVDPENQGCKIMNFSLIYTNWLESKLNNQMTIEEAKKILIDDGFVLDNGIPLDETGKYIRPVKNDMFEVKKNELKLNVLEAIVTYMKHASITQ